VYSKKIFGKIFDLFPKLDPCFEMGVKIKNRIFGKNWKIWKRLIILMVEKKML
jgi:hypothetical protein